MKRTLIAFLMSIALMFTLAISAFADVIWEPENDDFYDQHREEMTYFNRFSYANGESGYLEFFAKPNGKSLGFAKNAEEFYIGFIFVDDGVTWGLAEYDVGADGYFVKADYSKQSNMGYVKMQDTMVVYDSQSFEEEHGSEFQTTNIDVSGLIGKKDIVFWTYPHSGQIVASEVGIDEGFSAKYLYKDDEGLEWLGVGYYLGIKNAWICLSDPTNKELTADPFEPASFYPTPNEGPNSSGGLNTTQLAILLVAGVVLLSLLLILLLRKKNIKN